MTQRNDLRKIKKNCYHMIPLFSMLNLLCVIYNAYLELVWISRWTCCSISVTRWHKHLNASLEVLQWGPLEGSHSVSGIPQKKVDWSQVRWMWRPLYESTISGYLVPEGICQILLQWFCLVRRRAIMLDPYTLDLKQRKVSTKSCITTYRNSIYRAHVNVPG